MKRIIVCASFLVLTAAISACGDLETGGGNGGGNGGGTVTYEVSGEGVGKADITFTDGGTETTQRSGVALPWTEGIIPAGDAVVYQLIGQNTTSKGGEISCSITIDGEVVADNTSSGPGATATCEHTP